MKNATLTLALLLAFIASVPVSAVYAATSVPIAGVVRCTATGDTVDSSDVSYGSKAVGVKVNPIAGGKYYRLRKGSTSSGAIIYETTSGATTGTMVLDTAQFVMPGDGLYFETNDTGSNLTIYFER